MNVDGVVHPVTVEIVASAIAQAKQENASLVLVRLNTPGGLMDAMEKTIQEMLASPVPVVTYVEPSGGRAASAGFFLLEAGDVAAMAPSTRTGAAHPVAVSGDDGPRDGTEGGERCRRGITQPMHQARTQCGAGRDHGATKASLSPTAKRSISTSSISSQPNEAQLLADLDGRTVTRIDGRSAGLHTAGATIETYELSLRQRIMSSIADPNIALVLLVIGALVPLSGVQFAGIDRTRRSGRDHGAAGALRDFGAADQLAGRVAAAALVRLLHPRS